jgi:hypothetical protein
MTPLRGALVALGLMVVGGCDRGLTDINRNPNAADRATAEQLFTNAVEASVSRVFGTGLHMDITSLWVQHFAEHRYPDEDRYVVSDGTIGGHWSSFYVGPLQDFQEVIEKGMAEERANVVAMGKVMQNWTYHVMTDLWGDIGYSEALKGRDPTAGNLPALDTQEEVYDGILAAFADAEASLNPQEWAMGKADLIYGGDAARWKKFANSLRLRVAMRLSEVAPTKARAEFTAALAAGAFTSNADNAILGYTTNKPLVHPIFAYMEGRDDHTISATMVDTLKSFADPRLPHYATLSGRGEYVGAVNGEIFDPVLDSISRIGTHFTRPDAEMVIMSYAEVLFLQAEAAERGWIAGDAAEFYRQAITASMQDLGTAQADIDAYLAQPRVAYAGLPTIAFQKWIALFGNGVEAYAEWRRTGIPELQPGPDADNGGLIPVRLPYPSSEERRNGQNLKAAVDRQGGASLNDRLWWNR